MKAYQKYPQSLIDQIKSLHSQKSNCSEIGRAVGLHHNVVSDILLSLELQPYLFLRAHAQKRQAEFLEALRNGESMTYARRRLNINPKTAKKLAEQIGYFNRDATINRLTELEIKSRLHGDFIYEGFISKSAKSPSKHQRYKVRCIKCDRVFIKDPAYLNRGCRYCCLSAGVSNVEKHIANWLKDKGLSVVSGYKLGRKELDIYLPDHKLAIEYCGKKRWVLKL